MIGLPLGLRARGETAASAVLPESGLVVFYTDGLVEAERDIIGGIDRLVRAAARPEIADSPSPADALYAALLQNGNADDVVVLTLRLEKAPERSSYAIAGPRSRRWLSTAGTSTRRPAHDIRLLPRYVTEDCASIGSVRLSWSSANCSGTSCGTPRARLKFFSTGAR